MASATAAVEQATATTTETAGVTRDQQFVIKVPGKVILTGEHAVVYGKRAVAASVDLFTQLELRVSLSFGEFASGDHLILRLKDLQDFEAHFHGLDLTDPSDLGELERIDLLTRRLEKRLATCASQRNSVLAICFLYCTLVPPSTPTSGQIRTEMTVSSDIPIGAGMGSSAAFAVAMSAAVHLIRQMRTNQQNLQLDYDAINMWAFKLERLFHINPSGVDNTVCTKGGFVSFQGGVVQSLSTVNLRPPRILIVDTGVTRETSRMVGFVRSRWECQQDVVAPILDAIDAISHQISRMPEDYETVRRLLTMNHWLLAALGVSHPTLDSIVQKAAEHGQAAKLTGAGGGGLALIWIDPQATDAAVVTLQQQLKSQGWNSWNARLGVPGVSIITIGCT